MLTEYWGYVAAFWLLGVAIYTSWIVLDWDHPMPPPIDVIILKGFAWPMWLLVFLCLCVWFLIACIIDLCTGKWRLWFKKEKN